MDAAAVQERQSDEQKVLEAKMRARDEDNNCSGFGSSMEQNTAVRLMRARSESMSSTGGETDVASVAMTPEDRHVLEEEIRAQHTHPLARRVEQEAEERRIENERNFYRSSRGLRIARMAAASDSRLLGNRRASNSRNWNEIVNAFESHGNGEVNSLDDLVVLEAAIMLSMAEEDRRREGGTHAGNDSNDETNQTSFDAVEHARQGFPLVQSVLTDPNRPSSLARRPSASRRARSLRHFQHRDASDLSNILLLRGISEAEQIEMAIAMSLQQSQQSEQPDNSNDEQAPQKENQHETPGQGDAASESGQCLQVEDTVAEQGDERAPESNSSGTHNDDDDDNDNFSPSQDSFNGSTANNETVASIKRIDDEDLDEMATAVNTAARNKRRSEDDHIEDIDNAVGKASEHSLRA
jgi:hypothetical protein